MAPDGWPSDEVPRSERDSVEPTVSTESKGSSSPGTVYLVGSGPGDPGLITVRAWQLIRRADAILYDGLVNEQLLDVAPNDCVKRCVGKRGHGGSWTQSQINDLLVETARQHRHVVRLKGGDTGVFARTAEEIERLESEGIRYEVVPGITAALAVSAYTGIPITHRDWSSCIALVTGQGQAPDGYGESEEPMDWESLARFPGTLILYMGIASASQWSRHLIAAGKPASTPVALIRKCSWPDQQMLRCDLGSVEQTLHDHPGFSPPVISVIGDVLRAASQRVWCLEPSFRRNRFVVTSPMEQAQLLRDKLLDRGADCVLAPVIQIAPPPSWASLDRGIAALGETDWLVFSSVYGVRSFFGRLKACGRDARALASTRVAAVGTATAEAMAPFGIQCDLAPAQGAGGEALWQALEPHVAGKRVTVIRAGEGKTFLLDRLASAAARVQDCLAYQQQPVSQWPETVTAWVADSPRAILIATSSNIAARAVALLGPRATELPWLALSESVARTLHSFGCTEVTTSPEATFDSLAETAIRMTPSD